MLFSIGIVLLWLRAITHGEQPFALSTPHRVQFHLPDNTPSNHLVGNILSGISVGQSLARAMLNRDTWFRITGTGDLFTRDSLDRDVICTRLDCCLSDFCQITLEAYLFDSRQPTPITVQITLYIADENDNAPLFPQSPSNDAWWPVSIPESAAVGTKHTLPAATDADSSRFGIQGYKLFSATGQSSDGRLPFSLVSSPITYPMPATPSAPQLQIDRPLDRESKPSYDLYLVAEDAGAPSLTTTLSIRVNLLDTNDNPPTFLNQSKPSISIPENTAIGTNVYQFFVRDPDEGTNGNVSLSIDWSASYPGLNQTMLAKLSTKYAIHPYTGELRVSQPLDYENELERKTVLVIRASDNGSPQQTSSSSLTITLTDVNDNGPVIEVLGVDTKSDGNNDPVLFHENDAEPKLLRLISVTDPDSVSDGKLSCKLSDQHQGQRDFLLTSYSATMYGLLNARAFDYEREASRTGHLSVSVECTDAAEPKRTRQQWIQIPLADVNDNWPQFSRANYEFRVAENTEPGSEIGVIQATDADSGANGHVTYRLTSDTADWLEFIRIDARTGVVYVNAMLDREEIDRLEFHVTAMDGGPSSTNRDSEKSTQKTNTTGLTILIDDVNDNAPVCTGAKEIHVQENVPIGTRVLSKIGVLDPDLGANGSVTVSLIEMPYMYSMNLINPSQHSAGTVPERRQHLPFVIKDDLSLITSGSIDREQQTQMMLTLLVKDKGAPVPLSTTCSLTVLIDDVNDNKPQLIYPRNNSFLFGQREHSESSYNRATVPANTPFGSRLITIRGKDLDAGQNGTITYHLIPMNVTGAHELPMEFSEYGDLPVLMEENTPLIHDGQSLFNLDASAGYLTTAWGEHGDSDAEITDLPSSWNGTAEQVAQKRTKQPEPGLYAVTVELRDTGLPPLATKAMFYVNISEPVGTGFVFGLFSETNLSNTIILVLIMVCSFALIISLTAAIFWVRFRSDHSISNRQAGRNFTGGYNGGTTVISHESVPNGYFYPTNYPPLGSPNDLSDMEHGFNDATLLHMGKDGTLQTNWTDLNMDTEYQPGMYGGSLLTSGIDTVPTFQLHQMNKTDESSVPSNYPNGICLVPVSGDRGDLTIYQPSRTHCGTPNWLPCASEPYITDQTMIIRMDGGYGPAECMALGQATNNSTGGSDSGVDSGAGVVLGAITSPSPVLDARGRTGHLSSVVGKPGFVVVDHSHASTVPRTFAAHGSPTPLTTADPSETSSHDPAPSHKEPYFLIGSAASHTMHVVHHPSSTDRLLRQEETNCDFQTVPPRGGTISRPRNGTYSGNIISSSLQPNGLT